MKARNLGFVSKNLAAVAALVVSLVGATCVRAGSIDVASGLDTSGALITSSSLSGMGTPDAHWNVVDTNTGFVYSGPAHVVTSSNADNAFFAWQANGPNSDWIGINANTSANGPAPYTFSTTFDLTGYDLSTVSFTGGAWSIDDAGTLSLNGHALSSLSAAYSLTSFTVPNSDFVPGVNTLSIEMTSSDNLWEAVRLEGTVSGSPLASGVPEPASLTLLGIGLTIVGGFRLRRKHKSTP